MPVQGGGRLPRAAPLTGPETKRLTVVLACDAYSAVFDQPPEAFNGKTCFLVENRKSNSLRVRD